MTEPPKYARETRVRRFDKKVDKFANKEEGRNRQAMREALDAKRRKLLKLDKTK